MAAANTWNAFHALRLFPKEDNFHCMGSAKSTIDGCCMRPTNRANRQAAHNTLRDMSMVDPMSRDARELLHLLVPTILCLQNHQHQAGELYKELRARMRKARDGIAYRPTIVVARGWEPRRGIKSQALGAPVQPSWIVARRAEAEAALAEDSESDSEEEDDEAPLGTGHPPGAWPEEPNEEPAVEAGEPALVAAPEMGQVDNPMRDRHQRLAANAPHEVCTVRHVRRRPLEPDCPICILPMNIEDGVLWCKAECGQNLHTECMRLWEDSREEHAQLLCPFCREPWADPCEHDEQGLAANAPHEVCRVRHVRRRPLEADCAICTLPMNMEDGVVWCKAECGQNLHTECMRDWEDQREERGQLLCPFCRVPWAAPCEHDEQEPAVAEA